MFFAPAKAELNVTARFRVKVDPERVELDAIR
jgi:hypothetical protein